MTRLNQLFTFTSSLSHTCVGDPRSFQPGEHVCGDRSRGGMAPSGGGRAWAFGRARRRSPPPGWTVTCVGGLQPGQRGSAPPQLDLQP